MRERRLHLASPDDAASLGARIAAQLEAGDAVLLEGDLGAGKTTLARAVIAALTGETDAPSPTYTLVQSYEAQAGFGLLHADLYRLEDTGELDELGLDEALDHGAALIEWPDRLGAWRPADRLDIRLEETGDGGRDVRLAAMAAGRRALIPSSDRTERRAALIRDAGWADARETPFPGDASTRAYVRLSEGGRSAVLMDAPGAAEAPACPPDADPQARRALGYNARARLAGNSTAAFAAIASALTARGFSAPRVYAADQEAGYLLIEDLGDDLYARLIPQRAHEGRLYAAAIDTLAALYRSTIEAEPEAFGRSWRIQDYDAEALLAETELCSTGMRPSGAATSSPPCAMTGPTPGGAPSRFWTPMRPVLCCAISMRRI